MCTPGPEQGLGVGLSISSTQRKGNALILPQVAEQHLPLGWWGAALVSVSLRVVGRVSEA